MQQLPIHHLKKHQTFNMRYLLIAVALFTAAIPASAEIFEDAIGVQFPDEVAGLSFAGRKTFPDTALGINLAYQRPGPVRGSIYIYNGGLTTIPSKTDSPLIRKHFDQVIAELSLLVAHKKISAVNFHPSGTQLTAYEGCGPQFWRQEYELVMPDAPTIVSYTYLTAMKNNFIKLRVSYPRGDADGKRDTDRFVAEIRKVLGVCKP